MVQVLLLLAAMLPEAEAAPPASEPPSEPVGRTIAEAADRYLTARTGMGGFSGAVLIARRGTILLKKGYGYADVERRQPYVVETRHEVASVSKMFTAMAALKLRDQGRLGLEDPISQHLPDCPVTWRDITVAQLIHHTSGIPDYERRLELGSDRYNAFMVRPEASREIYEQAKRDSLEFPPGTRFAYSNTGYIVLSHVVERAAGMPFAEYVRRTLLEPAGMKDSGVLGTGKAPARLAVGYTHGDLGWTRALAGVSLTDGHLVRVPALALTPPEGDAWLYSTVEDLYRWSRVMDGGSLVSREEVAEAFTPAMEGYAAGWFVGDAFGTRRVRHNGFLPGYATDFIKFPDAGVTIVIFANLDRARMDRIARDLSAITFGTPWDMPVRGPVANLAPGDYARLFGRYRMADGKALIVSKPGDLLEAALENRYTAGLIPLSPTEFYMPLGDGRTTFTLGSDGQATRVNLRYGGEDHIADRVAAPADSAARN